MSTREVILDIVNHTGGLGFIDVVKITTENGATTISSMDEEKTVIVNGRLNEVEPKFVGSFGMSKLNVLKGYAELSTHKTDTATITVTTRERNGSVQAESIVFTDDRGTPATFRLMNSDLVPQQARFVGADWSIVFNPTKSALAEFSQRAGILTQFETYFFPTLENGELRFNIGEIDGSTHATYCIIATDVEGKLSQKLYWPIDRVLNILKLDTNGTATVKIADAGALQIEITTKLAKWTYILPARIK